MIKQMMKKVVVFLLVISMFIGIFAPFVNANEKLKNGETITDIERLRIFYPSFAEMVEKLKRNHPNWKFEFYNTGLIFDDITRAEFGEGRGLGNNYSPVNLIESYGGTRYSSEWIDPARAHLGFDSSREQRRWQAPSIQAVRYMMDPRTYLNEDDVFIFLTLKGNGGKLDEQKSKEIIRTILRGTKNEARIDDVYKVAKEVDIDLLELTSKLRQEGGLDPQQGINAYNPLNIGATGSNVIINGLNYAKERGWDTFEKGLAGGARIIKARYIDKKQDTKYLMKFNVENNSIYHQYMQNIMAPLHEGRSLKKGYKVVDKNLDGEYHFKIPLFYNMPGGRTLEPGYDNTYNATVITEDGINVRQSPTRNSDKIIHLRYAQRFEVIKEVKETTDPSFKWYKVRIGEKIGYAARYRVANPDNKYFEIREVEEGQTEELEGQTGDQIIFITDEEATYPADAIVTVSSILKMRNNPSTNGTKVLKTIRNGEKIKVLEKIGVREGYIWFKISYGGIEGYSARSKASNLTDVNFKIYKQFKIVPKDKPGSEKVQADPEHIGPKESIIQENEKKGIVLTEENEGKIRFKEGYMYISWEIELQKIIDKNPGIEIYNQGMENAQNGMGRLAEQEKNKEEAYKTGNIFKREDGKFYTIIRKGDISKDGKVGIADMIQIIQTLNNERQLDEISKNAAFVQLGFDIDTTRGQQENITCASNIVYVISKNIEKKYMTN